MPIKGDILKSSIWAKSQEPPTFGVVTQPLIRMPVVIPKIPPKTPEFPKRVPPKKSVW
jgi:hypothetical protein